VLATVHGPLTLTPDDKLSTYCLLVASLDDVGAVTLVIRTLFTLILPVELFTIN